MKRAVITQCDMLTPYGSGIEACWQGLMSAQTALAPVERFDVSAFHSQLGGLVSDLVPGDSIASSLIDSLFSYSPLDVPAGAPLLLATTTGEVDLVERAILSGAPDASAGSLDEFLKRVCERLEADAGGMVVSSACTSGSAALAQGASMIGAGEEDCVVVVACDAVTEFVYSGFSSLMALDGTGAHPFDADRRGLTIGEGAAYAVLMSAERAHAETLPVLGEIAGWGLSCDANHMTGPSRDGSGLARAIELALHLAQVDATQIASISAHGTGTVYNDTTEILAFKRVFDSPRPTYSIKGGIGHSMGAAGLIEAILTIKSLSTGLVPPTVGLRTPDEIALGWVSDEAVAAGGDYALSTNAGFGGVNAALVLSKARELME